MRLQIAEWPVEVDCPDEAVDYLPNWLPFLAPRAAAGAVPALCRVETGCTLPAEDAGPTLVNCLDERILRVWLFPDHCSVQLTLHPSGCSYMLRADRDWRRVCTDWVPAGAASYAALDVFLTIAFIYTSAFHHTILMHASSVVCHDAGCAFIGVSGVGKSTHARLWLEHIPGTRLLNDDQPVFRCMPDGSVRVYGSPWSGKTPCYRNEGAALKALFFMQQAKENRAVRLDGIETFYRLLESVSAIGRDAHSFAGISETLAYVAGQVPAYLLRNLPEKEAAWLSAGLVK